MSALYIPPQGIYFRLLGNASQNVLFSRTSPEPQVGQTPTQAESDIQFFTLVHGTGERDGTYAIKSKATGNVLFSRSSPNPRVGHSSGDAQRSDNWFTVELGSNQYVNKFRLITPSSGYALVSRTHMQPFLYNHPKGEVWADQYFSFVFEDVQIDNVEYDLALGSIVSSTLTVLTKQTLENNTNTEQEMSLHLNESFTHTSTFNFTLGFPIATGATFSAGVPVVGEDGFSVDTSASNQFTWGGPSSFSKSYTETFSVKVAPHQTISAVTTINKGDLEVPYTIHLSSKSSGAKTETKGIWRGSSTWGLRQTVPAE